MASIGAVAEAHRGNTTGFDYLRLGLALAVLAIHCLEWNDVSATFIVTHRPLLCLVLPPFFALSGFLVAGSLFRNTIPQFIALRIARLVPALAFEITLSAVLVGLVFTTLPWSGYVASPMLHGYFLNIVGDIHYHLPGVFDGARINGQLWTIPYELECYAILVGVALVLLLPIRRAFPWVLLAATALLTIVVCVTTTAWSAWHPGGRTLVAAFLWACVLYLFRQRVPYRAWLAVAALVVAELLLLDPRLEAAATLPIAYITIYIGLMKLPPVRFGDLSYGIFLFHYPVMQSLRLGFGLTQPVLLVGATLAVSCGFAWISWTLIEQPVLRRKRAILAGTDWLVARLGTTGLWRRPLDAATPIADGGAASSAAPLTNR